MQLRQHIGACLSSGSIPVQSVQFAVNTAVCTSIPLCQQGEERAVGYSRRLFRWPPVSCCHWGSLGGRSTHSSITSEKLLQSQRLHLLSVLQRLHQTRANASALQRPCYCAAAAETLSDSSSCATRSASGNGSLDSPANTELHLCTARARAANASAASGSFAASTSQACASTHSSTDAPQAARSTEEGARMSAAAADLSG